MPTQEDINAANVELQIANDNYAALANEYDRYNRVFDSYRNSSPEAQERAKGLMQEALGNYNQLKQQMYAAEDRIAVAQNRVNAINETIAAQQAAAAGGRRTVEPPIIEEDVVIESNGNGGPIIVPPTFDELPENVKRMIRNQPGNPFGSLTEGPGTSTADYLSNVYQGWEENISPQTWVYQNNSRAPGYNLGRKLGNATIPLMVMGGAWLTPSAFGVNEGALNDAKNALFRSNVSKVTNIPSQPYTTSPSNIPIKWTSPSNLPRYYTAPSNAPTVNVLRSNPSNITITPTSLTKFRIPGPTITL